VQFLVKEIQEMKSGQIVQEEDISCGNISSTTSAEVISGHLVTFRYSGVCGCVLHSIKKRFPFRYS
jgi:hypothetical protein